MRPFLGTVLQLADYQSFVPLYLLGECFQCITGKEISPVLHAVIIQRPLWYAEFCGGGIGQLFTLWQSLCFCIEGFRFVHDGFCFAIAIENVFKFVA